MLYVEDRLAAHLHLQNSVCVLFTVLEVWRDRDIQKDNKTGLRKILQVSKSE